MDFYYYSILLTIVLQSFAYLPLIATVYETQYTGNIPFATLFMLLLASLIQIIVALYKGYNTHLLVFLVFFFSIGYLIWLKKDYDINPVG